MKPGDRIGRYRVLTPFTTAGGGLSQWCFVESGGTEYFLKQFLRPVFPVEGSPGSEKTKKIRRQQCRDFEVHHRGLQNALKGRSRTGGNLVITEEFFRFGGKYYKTTIKIQVHGLETEKIPELDMKSKLILLLTVTHSLGVLHGAGIVHGDLKPDNILVKKLPSGGFTAKLIDFDNSYFEGRPPPGSVGMAGDVVYYAPEVGLFAEGRGVAEDLRMSADIFSLGLVFHQYWTGRLPSFDDGTYRYPYAAVLEGSPLKLSADMDPQLCSIIEGMLQEQPRDRPTFHQVFDGLKAIQARPDLPGRPRRGGTAGASSPGRLGGTLITAEGTKPEGTKSKGSKLSGSLLKNR